MDSCEIPASDVDETFEEVLAGMQDNKYWIRFFVRPCCPAPDLEGAINMLDKRKAEIAARDDFSVDEKQQLFDIIEERKGWYPSSGLCKK